MKYLSAGALGLSLLFIVSKAAAVKPLPTESHSFANQRDNALNEIFERREKDWRNGAVVYQVLVDRFAPSLDLEAKKHLYASPKQLRPWNEPPKRGHYLEDAKLWSHEIDFWGGDLKSLNQRLDYIQQLDIDVLYLNPIHLGFTNHKYDALDYHAVSPEYGSREDLRTLTKGVHAMGMKIVLDGVFNHMGQHSEIFQDALKGSTSAYRDWFYFNEEYPAGYRTWAGSINLPELNLENPAVQDHIYAQHDSVVQSYLNEGIDGWRLDVAYDLGFVFLGALTEAAHQAKAGSLIVGEIWNYPEEWFPSVDGIMNFTAREIIWQTALGELAPARASKMLARMIEDAGIDNMLKSWNVIDNHDTDRLKDMLPEQWQQRLAQVLQFTLPGSPNLYYGTELGMTGGEDPEMRGPMRWDWVNDDNHTLSWTKKLTSLHRQHRALKIGNFRPVESEKLLAFERFTNRADETIIVVVNPSTQDISESIMIANSKLMNGSGLIDLLDKNKEIARVKSGLVSLSVPAGASMILTPQTEAFEGYSPYKRVQ